MYIIYISDLDNNYRLLVHREDEMNAFGSHATTISTEINYN